MAKRRTPRSRSSSRRRSAVDELRAAVVDVHGDDDPVYCFVRRHGALPGAALLHLAAYDADPTVRAAALALVDAAAGGDSVPDEVGGAVLDAALEIAPGIADDPEADENARRLAAALLRSTGLDEPGDDPTAALVAAARAVEDTAASVEALLETAGLIQEVAPLAPGPDELERALALGELVAQGQPDVGATFLAVLAAIAHEHGCGKPLGLRALDAAASASPARAAWCLEELGRWPASGALGLHARNVARRLIEDGVTPRGLPAGRPPSRGHVTNVDGAGCRGLVLLVPGPNKRAPADAFVALLSDALGLKDPWVAWTTGKEAERAYSKPPRPSVTAPCDLTFTRALVGDALARHEAIGRPVPGRFLLCRQLLGPEPLTVQVHAPDLSAYDAFTPDERLVAGSGFLAEDTPFAGLACSSDAAYEVVRRSRTRGGRVAPALITRLLDAVEAEERDRLLDRLAANLEVLARRGEANRSLARAAHAVHRVLAERRVAWAEVQYLRALATQAIPAIRANLSLGFRSQADANAAGLLVGLMDGGDSRAR